MGYIRSNEDYYESCGMSPANARRQVLKDKLMGNADPGVCNPGKAKEYAEKEDEVDKLLACIENNSV